MEFSCRFSIENSTVDVKSNGVALMELVGTTDRMYESTNQ